MAVIIKNTTTTAIDSLHRFNLPPNLLPGDLIVAVANSYNGSHGFPTAWTAIGTPQFGTGTWNLYSTAAYRVVQDANESGISNTLTDQGGMGGYATMTQFVISGYDPASPISGNNFNKSTNNGTTAGTEAVYTVPSTSQGIFVISSMVSGTASQTNGDVFQSEGKDQNNYVRSYAYSRSSITPAGGMLSASISQLSASGPWIGRVIAVKEGNATPKVTSMTPSKYAPSGVVTSPSTFNWTYSDAETNTQYKYEISYREAGTEGAYTTFTSANAVTTTSHTFAANTFVDGKDYEWRLRLDDNQTGGWSPYYTDYFTAGKNNWSQNLPKASSAQSGVLIENNFPYGTFENASDVNVWNNNNFFGTYADTTSYAISTTRAKSGTSSLKVVFPTSSTQPSRVVADKFEGFRVGSRYLLQADIFVETGGPNVKIDAFLQDEYSSDVISTKNQWVEANCTFTAKETGIFFAMVTTENSTAGTVYMDNVRVYTLPNILDAGDYELQVRTADTKGFGPWSSSQTFKVLPPSNVFTKSGGSFGASPKIKYVRQGGVWVQLQSTKTKIGGTFS